MKDTVMRYTSIFFLLPLLASVVNAHFVLETPPPRGTVKQDLDSLKKFCNGYPNAASNRSEFPLSGGSYGLKPLDSSWTVDVLFSTDQNPNSSSKFIQAIDFHERTSYAGPVCRSLDLSKFSFQVKQNITIQFIFEDGQGNMSQCADVTLMAQPKNYKDCSPAASVEATRSLLLLSASGLVGLSGLLF